MLKKIVRSLAHLAGYEIMSLARAQSDSLCLAAILMEQEINLTYDVGANLGQFAQSTREIGYKGRIVSFEPLTDAYQKLCLAAKNDPWWIVAPRMALGSASGEIEVHVARNGVSSSVLPILSAHTQAEPASAYTQVEKVRLNRLDDVYPLSKNDNLLLKIDVQGYEKAVLEGAASVLKDCRAVIVEMSLVPLYEGQPLALELWDYMARLGFQARYFKPGFSDPRSKRLLQMDGVFVKE
jgi:FkbM family methyltransferase